MSNIEKMSLRNYKLTRKGSLQVVEGKWRDGLRRPRKVVMTNQPLAEEEYHPVLEGTRGEVMGILSGLAEVAWSLGWRPVGFVDMVAGSVAGYKVRPLEERE